MFFSQPANFTRDINNIFHVSDFTCLYTFSILKKRLYILLYVFTYMYAGVYTCIYAYIYVWLYVCPLMFSFPPSLSYPHNHRLSPNNPLPLFVHCATANKCFIVPSTPSLSYPHNHRLSPNNPLPLFVHCARLQISQQILNCALIQYTDFNCCLIYVAGLTAMQRLYLIKYILI